MEPSSWQEYQKYILAELKRLGEQHSGLSVKMDEVRHYMETELTSMKVQIAMLQVKSGVWGLLGGLIPVLVYMLSRS